MNEQQHREFLELYRPLHDAFVRFCSSHAYGVMETEDLVQETILCVLQRFEGVRDKQKLLGYMIAAASNIVKNHLRRRKFQGKYDERALRKLEGRLSDPEAAIDVHLLHQAMNKLPLKDKEALILFEITGMSMQEIADIQQAGLSATKTRISRARQKLRELLGEKERTRRLAVRLPALLTLL